MTELDQEALEALQGKVMGDIAGAMGLLMSYLGDQTGAYSALEAAGPCSSDELATQTGLAPRYLREWLSATAANGYVSYANVEFDTYSAKHFPGDGYDFACIFDALHDMGDPAGAAAHIRESLAPGGTFMLVEPLAGDSLADNLHLLGATYYGLSTVVCVPTSKAQETAKCLGAQAGEAKLREVLTEAGFGHIRRAAETNTNMVLEVRP